MPFYFLLLLFSSALATHFRAPLRLTFYPLQLTLLHPLNSYRSSFPASPLALSPSTHYLPSISISLHLLSPFTHYLRSISLRSLSPFLLSSMAPQRVRIHPRGSDCAGRTAAGRSDEFRRRQHDHLCRRHRTHTTTRYAMQCSVV